MAFFVLESCTEKQAVLPIEDDKLKKILLDVHIAEAAMQPIVGLKKDSLKELYFAQIFEIHQVHPVDFEATMDILRTDPKRIKKIYKELTEDVKNKKKAYSEKLKIKTDSIKSVSKSQQDTLFQ